MYINLIARQRAEQHRYRFLSGLLRKSAFILLVGVLGLVSLSVLQARHLSAEKAKAEAEMAQYSERARQVRALRARQAALKPTIDLLRKSQVTVNRWRMVLAEIALALPPTVWVEAIQPKFEGTSETVRLEAFSEDPPGVRQAMQRLNKSRFVKRAELTTVDIPATDPMTGKLSNPVTFAVTAELNQLSVVAQ